MKEEDFIERLTYRFDGKRFCRDCRRNVIREFKELKELKRMRREPQCTIWFCAADTAFLYEVSDDRVQADWHQTFADTYGTYHHFEWAVGTGVGKSDIMEFENVGMKGSVQVNGLDLDCLNSCYITLRAWKLDGRCSELSDDGSIHKDGNELDGECSCPQKHAKSPELARQFLLDAATVEKAFREGTARQNAHSIFVCLALKLLEGRVHVACKKIITLEKQKRRKSVKKKNARRGKEQKNEKKKAQEKGETKRKRKKEKYCSVSSITSVALDVSNEESSRSIEVEENVAINCKDSVGDTGDIIVSRPDSTNVEEQFVNGHSPLSLQNQIFDSPDGDVMEVKDGNGPFTERSKFSWERLKFRKDGQFDSSLKRCPRRQVAVVSESAPVHRSQPRYQGENFEAPSRSINGLNRQLKISSERSSGQLCGVKCTEKFQCSNSQSDRYNCYSCSCSQHNEYRAKMVPHVSATRVGREPKSVSKLESALDMSKQVPQGNKYNMQDYIREDCGKLKNKIMVGAHHSARDSLHCKKVWGAIGAGPDDNFIKSSAIPPLQIMEIWDPHRHQILKMPVNSQQGEITSLYTQNGFSECQVKGKDKKQDVSGGVAPESQALFGHSPDGRGNKVSGNLLTKAAENFEDGKATALTSSQHQSMSTSMQNQHLQFPFQAPSAMGYYHQNPVSWPATPANGLMPFPPNPYLYTAPLGYGSNGNSPLCMPYGTLLHLPTPLFNLGPVPIYHPISNVNGLYAEQIQFPEPGTEKEALPEVNSKGVPGRLQVTEQARKGEGRQNVVYAKLHTDDTSFSLFQFGGPVALSTGCKSNPVPLKDEIVVGEHSSQFSAGHVVSFNNRDKRWVEMSKPIVVRNKRQSPLLGLSSTWDSNQFDWERITETESEDTHPINLVKMATPQFLSSFQYSDSLTVVAISFCTAIVCEAISWLLIYRTNSYKSLKSSIDKAAKKLETMKTDQNPSKLSTKKSKTKKIDRVETSLKESSRDLSLFKFKSGAVVALVLIVVFGFLNSLFEGKVVAKLPFKPIGIVMKMSHRGLKGDDSTDCSMVFLYFLCSISIRTNLQKFLGFSPPRGAAGAGLFPMPDPKTN
ncbi:hypothetical protein Goarm_014708 [Gossypium armourianum]|uniref:Uncharacterized protein n=1 Tax=Gossypium armourianum TaxID=34283 RepID=A0A7J9J8F0_9ROSI|nr:hypothetical protein [Gossypium armourianum]